MDGSTYRLHEIKGQIESIFLAEYPDKILVLDTGCRPDVRRIRRYVQQVLHRDMADVKLAVVSHVHPDHAGGAPILRRRHRIPIAAPNGIDSWYTGFMGWLQHLLDFAFAWIVVIKTGQPFRRMWYPRKVRPDFLLPDGAPLPFFEDWRLLITPGHTSHHSVLFNERDGTLYVGDLFLKVNRSWHLPFPVTQPEAQARSLERLSRMRIRRLLLAHGGLQERFPSDLFASLMPGVARELPRAWRVVQPLMMLPPDIRRRPKE
jgi:glyoxylase-like metal-dependent hydrolase (beta-lactamase superfamily II)